MGDGNESYDSEDEYYDDEDDEDFERDGNASEDDAKFERRPRRKPRDRQEDLRSMSVSAADYVRSKTTEPAKKGKYGVTVPVPFNFDTREAVKPKTIRERKVEAMVNEKRMEE
jgi:hypothetical protein